MENQDPTISSRINLLIDINIDARAGYEAAAGLAQDATLKKIFTSLSAERDGYISQLKRELRTYRRDLTDEPAGTVKRSWKNLHAAVSNDDKKSIIIECINGEVLALEEYETVLDNVTRGDFLSQVLVRHRNGINSGLNGIKSYLGRE